MLQVGTIAHCGNTLIALSGPVGVALVDDELSTSAYAVITGRTPATQLHDAIAHHKGRGLFLDCSTRAPRLSKTEGIALALLPWGEQSPVEWNDARLRQTVDPCDWEVLTASADEGGSGIWLSLSNGAARASSIRIGVRPPVPLPDLESEATSVITHVPHFEAEPAQGDPSEHVASEVHASECADKEIPSGGSPETVSATESDPVLLEQESLQAIANEPTFAEGGATRVNELEVTSEEGTPLALDAPEVLENGAQSQQTAPDFNREAPVPTTVTTPEDLRAMMLTGELDDDPELSDKTLTIAQLAELRKQRAEKAAIANTAQQPPASPSRSVNDVYGKVGAPSTPSNSLLAQTNSFPAAPQHPEPHAQPLDAPTSQESLPHEAEPEAYGPEAAGPHIAVPPIPAQQQVPPTPMALNDQQAPAVTMPPSGPNTLYDRIFGMGNGQHPAHAASQPPLPSAQQPQSFVPPQPAQGPGGPTSWSGPTSQETAPWNAPQIWGNAPTWYSSQASANQPNYTMPSHTAPAAGIPTYEASTPGASHLPLPPPPALASETQPVPQSMDGGYQSTPHGVAYLLRGGLKPVAINGAVVIGREPHPQAIRGISEAQVYAVPSPTAEVSRSHCAVFYSPNGWAILDLGSRNGTFIQRASGVQEHLVNGMSAPIASGDLIGLGDGVNVEFRIH